MRRITTVLAVAFVLALATPAVASNGDEAGRPLTAVLSADNEVPPSGTGATGVAQVTLNQGQGRVCVTVAAQGLAGDVVAGHIHAGEAGANGGVVVNLGVNSADYRACIDEVDRELIQDIRQNPQNYYVNIHTTVVPSGEIRGQLSK